MAYQDEYSGASAQMEEHERLIGFAVEDETGEKVGTVKAVWEDHTGQPAYLGVATGWLGLGRIHVVPVHYASISESAKRIRLPFAADTVKNAPDYDSDFDIASEGETAIRNYYRDHGVDTDFNPDPGDPSMYISRGHGPNPGEGEDWTARANAPLAYGETAEEPTKEMPAQPEILDEDMDVREEEPEIQGERPDFAPRERNAYLDRDETTRGGDATPGAGPGGARLRKIIRSEQFNQPVDTGHEDGIFVPLRREAPDVSKGARGSEELRKEDADID